MLTRTLYSYLSPADSKQRDELTYGIQNRKGLILLTGEVGTGKTTLITTCSIGCASGRCHRFIFNSHLSANHCSIIILNDFGIPRISS